MDAQTAEEILKALKSIENDISNIWLLIVVWWTVWILGKLWYDWWR